MKTYIIEQKESGTGSIHDIASHLYEREIKFPKGSIYAVVLADYYGGKGYTTHRDAWAAHRKSQEMRDYSHEIIDADGNSYDRDYDRGLVRISP